MRPLILALTWDPTISAGNLLTAAMMLGGVLLTYVKLREDLVEIKTRLQPLWDEYTERRKVQRRAADRQ
jgi:hypothetical protein